MGVSELPPVPEPPFDLFDIQSAALMLLERSVKSSGKLPDALMIGYGFADMSPSLIATGWNDRELLYIITSLRNAMKEPERVDIFLDNEPFELP